MDSPVASSSGSPHPNRFEFKAALGAGIIASLLFQLLEIILMPLFGGGGAWDAARMIAAIVLGQRVLVPTNTFDLSIVVTALVLDILLAIIYTTLIGWFIARWRLGRTIVFSAVFGVLLYLVNFYGFTQVFPWFEEGRNAVTLVTHILFSVIAGLAYRNLRGRSIQAATDGHAA